MKDYIINQMLEYATQDMYDDLVVIAQDVLNNNGSQQDVEDVAEVFKLLEGEDYTPAPEKVVAVLKASYEDFQALYDEVFEEE